MNLNSQKPKTFLQKNPTIIQSHIKKTTVIFNRFNTEKNLINRLDKERKTYLNKYQIIKNQLNYLTKLYTFSEKNKNILPKKSLNLKQLTQHVYLTYFSKEDQENPLLINSFNLTAKTLFPDQQTSSNDKNCVEKYIIC